MHPLVCADLDPEKLAVDFSVVKCNQVIKVWKPYKFEDRL